MRAHRTTVPLFLVTWARKCVQLNLSLPPSYLAGHQVSRSLPGDSNTAHDQVHIYTFVTLPQTDFHIVDSPQELPSSKNQATARVSFKAFTEGEKKYSPPLGTTKSGILVSNCFGSSGSVPVICLTPPCPMIGSSLERTNHRPCGLGQQ